MCSCMREEVIVFLSPGFFLLKGVFPPACLFWVVGPLTSGKCLKAVMYYINCDFFVCVSY